MRLERDMSCSEIVELVTEYVEGGLSTADRDRFEEHIGFCTPCLTYLDQMRQTVAGIGEVEADELPPELQSSLVEAFRDWKAGS
jgi:putative zinc finger protein